MNISIDTNTDIGTNISLNVDTNNKTLVNIGINIKSHTGIQNSH